MESIKYYLVLELRLGDYNLIDINKLDICNGLVNNELLSIDVFTSKFTEEEIKGSIERSNTVQPAYLTGSLKVISEAKHNFRVLTKDIIDIIQEFQYSEEDIDQNFKNKIYGAYKKVVESTFEDVSFIKGLLDKFKTTLRNGNKREIFLIIEQLPYNKSRLIYYYIYNEIIRRKEEKLRKLEKLDDN